MTKNKLDIIADIEPAVAQYYTVNNKLYSMPFNSSAPVMYFDKNAFKEAGLDPTKKNLDLRRSAGRGQKADQEGRQRQDHSQRRRFHPV